MSHFLYIDKTIKLFESYQIQVIDYLIILQTIKRIWFVLANVTSIFKC